MFIQESLFSDEFIKLETRVDKINHCITLLLESSKYPKAYCHPIFLNTQNQFNELGPIEIEGGPCRLISSPDKIILTLPNVQGELIIDSNGELNLGNISTRASLEFNNITAIHVFAPIRAQAITLRSSIIQIQSDITATEKLKIKADYWLYVDKSINADSMKIFAKGYFINHHGLMMVHNKLILSIYKMVNHGSLSASEINIKPVFSSLQPMDGHEFSNHGLIEAIKVKIKMPFLINQGNLKGLKRLILNVSQMLKHFSSGVLSSNEIILVQARNMQLMGKMISQGDVILNIQKKLYCEAKVLEVEGFVKLSLEEGGHFENLLQVLGSLTIQTNADIRIATDIQVAKKLKIIANNLYLQEGGIFANEKLKAKIVNGLFLGYSNSAPNEIKLGDTQGYLASNGKIVLRATTMHNNLGIIYTCDDLIIKASSLLKNSGNMMIEGNARIITPSFYHKILTHSFNQGADALSPKPNITVSKNCTLQGNTEILAGELSVGGKLLLNGNMQACSFRAYRSWFDTQLIKGGRKGLFRGHHYYEQRIPREKTLAVYDSQISAGEEIKIKSIKFLNQGAFRTTKMMVEFQELKNANTFLPLTQSFKVDIPLKLFFQENALFGRVQDDRYLYGPKLPLNSLQHLKPPAQIEAKASAVQMLFAPIIEKALLQHALHQQIRSGYIDEGFTNPESILVQLRENAYNLSSSKTSFLSLIQEQNITCSEKALLYYRAISYEGSLILEPWLHLPPWLCDSAEMGTSDEAVLRAKTIFLLGNPHASMKNTHRIQADCALSIFASKVENIQYTYTNWVPVVENLKKGRIFVPVKQAVQGRGILTANKIMIEAEHFSQVGGAIHTGLSGMQLKIQKGALIKALSVTRGVQGTISRKGRNYQIEANFIPAQFISEKSQVIRVAQGAFVAEGLHLIAQELITIQTAAGITIKNAQAVFELASFGTRKKITTGHSYASCHSLIQSSVIEIISNKTSIRLINVQLMAMKEVRIKANHAVEVLSNSLQKSYHIKERHRKGLQWSRESISYWQTETLTNQWIILGDAIIEANQTYLQAISGLISKNMIIKGANILIEGSSVQQAAIMKLKSLTPMLTPKALSLLLKGEIYKSFLHAVNLEPLIQSIQALAKAKLKQDFLIQAMHTFIVGWRLSVLMAQAYQEKDILGLLTDRYGLTSPQSDPLKRKIQHRLNPKLTLQYNKKATSFFKSYTVPTSLMVEGNLQMTGEVIQLREGFQIEARTILLYAKKLLEIIAARNIIQAQQSQENYQLGLYSRGKFGGGNVNQNKACRVDLSYEFANLKARGLLTIVVEECLQIKGAVLDGQEIIIQAKETTMESLPAIQKESNHYKGMSIDNQLNLSGVGYQNTASMGYQLKNFTKIDADTHLTLFTDRLVQRASFLSAKQKLEIMGIHQKKPLSWLYEDIQDNQKDKSQAINLQFSRKDSFPVVGSLILKQKKEVTLNALDLANDTYPPMIANRVLKSRTATNKSSAVAIPLIIGNVNQIKQDWRNIQTCFKK